jgi:hypothetical protein
MSDERWPYGTVVEHRGRTSHVTAMVVHDGSTLWLVTLWDPDNALEPAEFYEGAWEWTMQRLWWTRVEDT